MGMFIDIEGFLELKLYAYSNHRHECSSPADDGWAPAPSPPASWALGLAHSLLHYSVPPTAHPQPPGDPANASHAPARDRHKLRSDAGTQLPPTDRPTTV